MNLINLIEFTVQVKILHRHYCAISGYGNTENTYKLNIELNNWVLFMLCEII